MLAFFSLLLLFSPLSLSLSLSPLSLSPLSHPLMLSSLSLTLTLFLSLSLSPLSYFLSTLTQGHCGSLREIPLTHSLQKLHDDLGLEGQVKSTKANAP